MNRIIFLNKLWEEHFTNYVYFSQITSLKAPIYNNLRTIRFVGCFFIYGYQIEKGINLDNLLDIYKRTFYNIANL